MDNLKKDQELKMSVTISSENYEKLEDGIVALQVLQYSTKPGKISLTETDFAMIKANALAAAKVAVDFVEQLGGAEVEILQDK